MGGKSGGGPSSVTVTYYAYYIGMHMVMCVSAEESHLYDIQVNEVSVFSGDQNGSGRISINLPEAFGGREREGGVVGQFDFMDGGPTQQANDYLTALQPTSCGYRGVVSLVARKPEVQSNNPFLKPWKFKVACIHGTWYPEKAKILGNEVHEIVQYVPVACNLEEEDPLGLPCDMFFDPNLLWLFPYETQITYDVRQVLIGQNPAHIIYEILVSPRIGRGLPASSIDETSFMAAADTLYDEGFGLSLAWTSQTSLEAFLQLIVDHIGGVCLPAPGTGLYTLFLLRPGQTAAATIEPRHVVRFEEYEESGWGGSVNEYTVRYTDIRDGKVKSVTVHDLAAIERQGGVVSQSVDYLGLPTQELAERVALRDLSFSVLPVKKIRLVVDRSFYTLFPGQIISVFWPDYGLAGEPFRVVEIDHGTQDSNEISISAATDVYTQDYAASLSDTPLTVPRYPPPLNANPRSVYEAPYWFLDRYRVLTGFPTDLLESDTFLMVTAGKPQEQALNFVSAFRHGGSSEYVLGSYGEWSGSLLIRYSVSRHSTSLLLHRQFSSSPDRLKVGGFAVLGRREIVQIVGIDLANWEVTVNRGMLDTVPIEHSPVMLTSWNPEDLAFSYDVWNPGESATALALTKTSRGSLAIEDASEINITVSGSRQGRPLPPGGFSVNGVYLGEIFTGPADLTWKHRNRLTQTAEYQVTQSDGSVAPEPNTEYFLRIIDEEGIEARTETLTGNPPPEQYLYDLADEQSDTGRVNAKLTFELWARRDGYDSWTHWSHTAFRALSTLGIALTNPDFCDGTTNGWTINLGAPVARPIIELPFSGCSACQFVLGNQAGNESDTWEVYQEIDQQIYSSPESVAGGLTVLEVFFEYRAAQDGGVLQPSVSFYDDFFAYISTDYGDAIECPSCGWAQGSFFAASPPGGRYARITFHAEPEEQDGQNPIYIGCMSAKLHGRLPDLILSTAVTPEAVVQGGPSQVTSLMVQAIVPRSQIT